MTRAQQVARESQPVKKAALILGPGFITGAADDDPSGIGTYSVAGASLGLSTLWTALLTFPFMAAVQTICSRLGLVSGAASRGSSRSTTRAGSSIRRSGSSLWPTSSTSAPISARSQT